MSPNFYRELYDSEWARRDELRQGASLPAGVLTLLAGVLVFYARTYSFQHEIATLVFVAAFAGASIAFLVAVYMLARSLFGPHYRRIPWPSQIRDYEEGLRHYYRGQASSDEIVARELEAFLIDRYVDAANRNAENNANAGEYVYNANRAVVVALIAVAVAAFPVIVDFRSEQQLPQKVEITNWPGATNE